MVNINIKKGTIGVLTGGGDVPGLNPAIRAITIRAIRAGYQVIGIRRGWAGLMSIVRDKQADNHDHYRILTEDIVNQAGRTGGTFLHSSRTHPGRVTAADVPDHLQDKYNDELNDLTPEVLENLDFLGIDYLIPIGGDDNCVYIVTINQLLPNVFITAVNIGLGKVCPDNSLPGSFSSFGIDVAHRADFNVIFHI